MDGLQCVRDPDVGSSQLLANDNMVMEMFKGDDLALGALWFTTLRTGFLNNK